MVQDSKNTLIRIHCTVVVAPITKKAFLADFHDLDGDKLGQVWLPYSRVTQRRSDCGGFTVQGEETGTKIIAEIPQWLCESDGLEPLIREQLLVRDCKEDDGRDIDPEDDIPF